MSDVASNVQGSYLFALVDDGGVAVNLRTGAWSGLNRTAAAICRAFEQHRDWEDARSMLQARWLLSPSQAAQAVDGVRNALEQAHGPLGTERVVPYRRRSHDYALFHEDEPVLGVDLAGSSIRVLAPSSRRRAPLSHYFRLVSPKVLAAHGHLVLHAAACLHGTELTAFIGPSGAGKSTTTNLLAQLGLTKLADDLLVVCPPGDGARVFPEAEERIYTWCDQAADEAARAGSAAISTTGLLKAAISTSPMPLHRIVALSAERSAAASFTTRRLNSVAALERLMPSAFLGSTEPAPMALYLEACRTLSQSVPTELATTPDGLQALASALRGYIGKTAS